jgi:hypothetical protein
MKLYKLSAFVLATAIFASCSEEELSWNSSAATVSMEQAELVYKENKGMVNVPIVVDGELNGPVEVTVEVAEVGENPAMEDVHYIVTSKTVLIPADATSGKIEFKTVDDADINEARTFVINIKSVNGATVGEAASTTVTLKDNDSQFYEKLQGRWKMTSSAGTWNINIIGAEEGEEGYNEVFQVTGIMGYDWTSMTMFYSYDVATKTGYVYIPFGYIFAEGVNFGLGGTQDVATGTVVDGYINFDGGILGTWNEDFTEITFEDKLLYGFLLDNGAPNGYTWFNCSGIKMVK